MPLDIEQIRAARPENQIHYFPTVGSTMQNVSLLASAGAPPGTVVLAEEQTAGIGRHGRSWISEGEVGVYCSILLRLALPPDELPIATLLLGLATAEAIQTTTDLACDLRWPNDVLIRGRKAAGILAQMVSDDIIAGIGINVNQTSLPDNLRTPATSLRIESGNVHSREALIIALLRALQDFTTLLADNGSAAIRTAFAAASSYATGRRVQLEETGQSGTTAGLDQRGFLLVRLDSGEIERIAAGGVRALE